MTLSQIVNIQISRQTTAPTQKGFGTALFLASSVPTGYTTRFKAYSSIEEMQTDGWTTEAAFVAATKYFGQELKPEKIYIGLVDSGETYTQALQAVQAVNNDWYVLLAETHVKADILALAAAIEPQDKMYICSSSDSDIITSVNTDVASSLHSANYDRTAIIYSSNAAQYPEAAIVGLQLPKAAGSSTWKFKTLKGITVDNLTTTQISNAKNKMCNVYTTIAGVNILHEGVVSSGEFIDVIQGIDFIKSRLQENIYFSLINSEKIPYTNAGISVVVNIIKQVLTDAIDRGILAASPTPEVSAPLVDDVSAIDKANRLLPNVKFSATLAGAVHKIQINGIVTI
jgi:hypothetical protein